MATVQLTMAQALIRYLSVQHVERDGYETPFFAGCWGIFGHGNVAGIGQALQQYRDRFRYYLARNEQAMVNTAAAYAKMKNRLAAFACTTSIGPGATNMITGAALATINRLPVLLLPGDNFAERIQAPVLQQLESAHSQEASVNDAFKPISRYWDRLHRPEQLIPSIAEAMRVLTSPAETGAVTLALPQDVQTMAYRYPAAMFEPRVWHIPRNRPDSAAMRRAVDLIRASKQPIVIAGGGVHYSDAAHTLRFFADSTGIPVGETQAGKGALPYAHPLNLGAVGVTGTPGANTLAREADLVIGVGTRYTDFTTASNSAFQNPDVRFININVAEFDAYKRGAIALVGDARVALDELCDLLGEWHTDEAYQARAREFSAGWDQEVSRIYNLEHGPLISQGEVIGAVNVLSRPQDVVVGAAGSLPGDLHKLWRTRDVKGYHLEYGYSTMGYEIAAGLGVKMAAPEREVYVMVGDGSYLMLSSEIVTSIQEGIKLTIIVIDNHGFASIGGLSKAVGSDGFGTQYRYRGESGQLDGETLPVDFVQNATSLGAASVRVRTRDELASALVHARQVDRTVVIVVETDRRERVGGYEAWWDVAIAEVSENLDVQRARRDYEEAKTRERWGI